MDSVVDDHTSRPDEHQGTALRTLTEALEDPGIDLDKQVAVLRDDLVTAIPSLLTVTLTVTVDDYDFRVTAVSRADPSMPVGSSLLVPLGGVDTGDSLVAQLLLRAITPGALVDFAADSTHLLSIPRDGVLLDRHLDSDDPNGLQNNDLRDPRSRTGESSLSAVSRSVIDRAVGVLCERDAVHTVATARAVLSDLAERDRVPVVAAAQRIVADTVKTRPERSQP